MTKLASAAAELPSFKVSRAYWLAIEGGRSFVIQRWIYPILEETSNLEQEPTEIVKFWTSLPGRLDLCDPHGLAPRSVPETLDCMCSLFPHPSPLSRAHVQYLRADTCLSCLCISCSYCAMSDIVGTLASSQVSLKCVLVTTFKTTAIDSSFFYKMLSTFGFYAKEAHWLLIRYLFLF